jgi:hypothetical protein
VRTPDQHNPCQATPAASLEVPRRQEERGEHAAHTCVQTDRDVALGDVAVTSNPEFRAELACSPVAEIARRTKFVL